MIIADETAEQMAALAMRGRGIGSSILYACLSTERRDGSFDWRRAALSLAQAANRMNELATEALTRAPAPLIVAVRCPGCGHRPGTERFGCASAPRACDKCGRNDVSTETQGRETCGCPT